MEMINPTLIPLFRIFIILSLIHLAAGKTLCQTKVYTLFDETYAADIRKNLLIILDTTPPRYSLMDNVFKPTTGKYTVYRFLATYQGISYTNKQKEFHDVLIVKTNNKNKVVDAYQYTLEWTDSPFADLYESTARGLYLNDSMPVEDFKFKRLWDTDKNDRPLKDSGVVRFE